MLKSRGNDIDEHADGLIRIIFETVDRAAGGVNAIAQKQVGPGTVQKKANPAFDDIEPFVLAFVVMRPRTAARRSDIEKAVTFPPVCSPSSTTTIAWPNARSVRPSIGSFQERIVEQGNWWVRFDIGDS